MAKRSKVFDEMRAKVATQEDVLRHWGSQHEATRLFMSTLFVNMEEIGTWTDDRDELERQAEKLAQRLEHLPDSTRQKFREASLGFVIDLSQIDKRWIEVLLWGIYGSMFINFMKSEKPRGRPNRMQIVNQYLAQKAAQKKASTGDSWPTVADDLIADLEGKPDRDEIEEAALKKLSSNKAKMPRGRTGEFLQMYVIRYFRNNNEK